MHFQTYVFDVYVLVCDVGTFRDVDDGCALCPRGTFKGSPSDGACPPCSNGSITLNEGATYCGNNKIVQIENVELLNCRIVGGIRRLNRFDEFYKSILRKSN